MSLSRVDLPEPFTPISPVRPGPNDTVRPDSTDAPSGQLKLRSEQTIAAVMRRGSHVGKIPVRVATPRRVGSEHLSSGRGHAHERGIADLTASTHSPTADSRDASMLARPLAHANRIRDSMIVARNRCYVPETGHDHETAVGGPGVAWIRRAGPVAWRGPSAKGMK